MDYLLDTHTFIWFLNGAEGLPKKIKNRITDVTNNYFLSIASIWEMGVKLSLNKLQLNADFSLINDFIIKNEIIILPIEVSHIQSLINLPFHHKDPFDRLIIDQAQVENLNILTNDSMFENYLVQVYWD
jgi:PIN domain nuclease of toxin-antitoxin system